MRTTPNRPTTAPLWVKAVGSAAAALAFAGCGGGSAPSSQTVHPVTGQVLLRDGKPLTGASVIFLPKGEAGTTAQGELGPDGTFSLKTPDNRDGAAAGEYTVRIVPGGKYVSKALGRVDPKTLPFSPTYMDEDGNTGLTATVKAEPTKLPPFKLADARSGSVSHRSPD